MPQEEAEQSSYEEPPRGLPAPGGMGGSPDGISGDGSGNFTGPTAVTGSGSGYMPLPPEATQGAVIVPHGQSYGPGPGGPMAGQTWQGMEPADTSGSGALRSAGFTALLLAAGVGGGVAVGGAWGAAAGFLLASALANGYRAQKWLDSEQPSQKHEAVVSGVFAAGAVGAGIWAAYKAYQHKQEEDE
jgi:hypothetical protein